jgi:glycine cleavage system aminomethyltransferase T
MDDGTAARLSEDHFVVTTTNAARLQHMGSWTVSDARRRCAAISTTEA